MSFNELILNQIPPVDIVGVEKQIDLILHNCSQMKINSQDLRMILNMIDLTTLDGRDTDAKVREMCSKAVGLNTVYDQIDTVAAICVYPTMVQTAKSVLLNSSVKLASVATGFPSGQTLFEVKLLETKLAIQHGVDEIDMVISRGKFLEGEFNFVFDEIAAIKEVCGDKILKVILETGELSTLDNIRKASEIAIYAGADFIKTSTGKIQPGSTMPAVFVMLQAIKEYYIKTGREIGIKPSGGISSIEIAFPYLEMIREVLGEKWLLNNLVRFGASSLANNVLEEILKIESGKDLTTDYFLFG